MYTAFLYLVEADNTLGSKDAAIVQRRTIEVLARNGDDAASLSEMAGGPGITMKATGRAQVCPCWGKLTTEQDFTGKSFSGKEQQCKGRVLLRESKKSRVLYCQKKRLFARILKPIRMEEKIEAF